MFAACCWRPSLAIDGSSGTPRGHGSVMRRPGSRWDGAVERPSAFQAGHIPKLPRIARALCAVAGRWCPPLAAAVAVTVAVSRNQRRSEIIRDNPDVGADYPPALLARGRSGGPASGDPAAGRSRLASQLVREHAGCCGDCLRLPPWRPICRATERSGTSCQPAGGDAACSHREEPSGMKRNGRHRRAVRRLRAGPR